LENSANALSKTEKQPTFHRLQKKTSPAPAENPVGKRG